MHLRWRTSRLHLLERSRDQHCHSPSSPIRRPLELPGGRQASAYRLGNRHLDLLRRRTRFGRINDATGG
jgi:hypothetical protein